jgi:hypothetical protein
MLFLCAAAIQALVLIGTLSLPLSALDAAEPVPERMPGR